ncbi:NSFL1 cofactor p47-like [Haliotis rufescens]|uniref:NSFL1 cofactor p47-like n=1 Tax=Haliotis rufescens TaxID=6454 RepID=UPI001EAFE945|nr:NSFL1 cofactor p47-like [Haliotis rufescens]
MGYRALLLLLNHSNMADKQELIDQFVGVTGIDVDRARFHLESAAWNLELAMASFYEDGDAEPQVVEVDDDEDIQETAAPSSGDGGGRSQSAGQSGGGSRFATISSMKDKEEDSDSDEGQAFYAGGSERSGQQVLGPPKKKSEPDEVVDTLFKSAKEHGAEVVDASENKRKKAGPSFRGTGYRLGDTEGTSHTVQGAKVKESRQVDMVLKLWKNGFSMDDGPWRDYNDPANKDFLDSIGKGEVPRELIRLAKGGEVNLNMEDHRNEEYVKPKVPVRAFTGAGRMLGSPVPNLASKPPEAAGASAVNDNTAQQAAVAVDTSKPTTSIQIRLADGSRLVAKFNHSHRISDIRNYIISSHPQYAGVNFVLMTTFPNKELTEESVTLEDAKLLNAVIVQRQK